MRKLALILLISPLALSVGCIPHDAYAYHGPFFDDGNHMHEPRITRYPGAPYRDFQQPFPPQAIYPQPSFPQPGNPASIHPQALYIYPQAVYIYPPPPSPQPATPPRPAPQVVYPQSDNPDFPRTDPQAIFPRPAFP